jgi:hypothetical protein
MKSCNTGMQTGLRTSMNLVLYKRKMLNGNQAPEVNAAGINLSGIHIRLRLNRQSL